MIGRLAAMTCAVALAGCAGMEPVGRNASPRSPSASPPPAAAPAQAPISPRPEAAPTRANPGVAPVNPATPVPAPSIQAQPLPPAQAAPAQTATPISPRVEVAPTRSNPSTPAPQATPVPAPPIVATSPARAASPARDDDEIVVPGTAVERQIAPPNGDPRNAIERMEDIRAWDQCVTHVQSAYERNPTRPQLDSPEEYCARSLGMPSRTAVPESRIERRR